MQTILSGGEWIDGVGELPVRNPYTGAVVGVVATASSAQALDAARHLRTRTTELTAFDRAEILAAAAAAVRAEAVEYAELITAESGLARNDADREVARAVSLLGWCAEEAKRVVG